jgi:Domain of unknown function (DUF4440)
MTMGRVFACALAAGAVLGGLLAGPMSQPSVAAGEEQAVLQADHEFVKAATSGDKAALGKLLDANFTWTNAEGKTETRAAVLKALPHPGLGDESGAEVKQDTYGEVGAVMVGAGKLHVLRIWVKRPAGWRALIYHEVKLSDEAPKAGGSGVTECINPCKEVPYKPKSEGERGVIASWQALETGVTAHDAAAWAPHIADEFVMLNSNNERPYSKADRIAILNKQKESGKGSAPSPLVEARMFDFPGAIIMRCLHQPHHGKPVHVTRLWIERDGKWVLSISFQTTVQAAPAKS